MSGGGSRNPTPPIGRPASTPTPPQVSRVSMTMAVGAGHSLIDLLALFRSHSVLSSLSAVQSLSISGSFDRHGSLPELLSGPTGDVFCGLASHSEHRCCHTCY
jgi:hypothetical protein